MRALLMHPDRAFDVKQALPDYASILTKDLELNVLLDAMANDEWQLDVARKALLLATSNDLETVRHRQSVMADCLGNADSVRTMYEIACGAVEDKRHCYWGFSGRYPSSVLHGATEVLGKFVKRLRSLRDLALEQESQFHSAGFRDLFAVLKAELTEDYLKEIEEHLAYVKFKGGVLVSAALGLGNAGDHYVLRRSMVKGPGLLDRLLGKSPPAYSFRLHPRDEAGARYVSDLRSQGINLVANALGQSTDHILGFFETLRTELAFYVSGLNLRDRLTAKSAPITLPVALAQGQGELRCQGLYDVCLALNLEQSVVGNTIDADGKRLIVITGANQGGKSSFMRALGLAQLMMQSGLFVAAESLTAELCSGLFTHYKREEDTTMVGGKLDEELARLSSITQYIRPRGLLLLNESFASTNEREGAELASQVVSALLQRQIKVIFVTHLYAFSNRWYRANRGEALFLRAERCADGTRTFRLAPGEPYDTSYGGDLYVTIFGADGAEPPIRATG